MGGLHLRWLRFDHGRWLAWVLVVSGSDVGDFLVAEQAEQWCDAGVADRVALLAEAGGAGVSGEGLAILEEGVPGGVGGW